MLTRHLKSLAVLLLFSGLVLACGKGQDVTAQDCDTATVARPKTKTVVSKTVLKLDGVDCDKADWCRACALSKQNFVSCQRVWQGKDGQTREELKVAARDKACKDAGYEKAACPQSAVVGVQCKGDPDSLNPTTTQDLLDRMQGKAAAPAGAGTANAPPAPSAPAGGGQ